MKFQLSMSMMNWIAKQSKRQLKHTIIISPIVPHICHQLWLDINHDQPIIDARWPKFDSSLLKSETSLIVVQVNGKLRSKLEVDASIGEDELKSMALSDEKVYASLMEMRLRKLSSYPKS